MSKNAALLIAGLVFTLVSLIQLSRLIFKFDIIIGGNVIPMGASLIGFIVALLLATLMFVSLKRPK